MKIHRRILSKKPYIWATAFAVIGLTTLLFAKAATNATAVEPEVGTLTGNIAKGTDSTASTTGYVQFGKGATAALQTNPTTVANNGTFTVTVKFTTTRPVVAANMYVTYNPSQLSYVSIDYAGSPLTTDTPDFATGSGFVNISRYNTTPAAANSTYTLATLTFKAISPGVTSLIGIDETKSVILDNGATGINILGGTNGTSILVL